MADSPTSVCEVLAMLRAAHASCEALHELQEFELALNEIWSALATLSETTQEVTAALQFSATAQTFERSRLAAATSAQILAAFSQLCRAVRTWAILDPNDDGDGDGHGHGGTHSALATPAPMRPIKLPN